MTLNVSTKDGVAFVALNRPPVNAMDLSMVDGLKAAFEALGRTPGTLGMVLTGGENCFSAGVDVKAFAGYDAERKSRMILAISQMIAALYALPFPVVSAVGGHALGGGFVLMLGGDFRIAVDDDRARLGLTEAKAGIPFPAGPLEVIAAELTADLVRRLTLTSQTLSPVDLHGLGEIDELAPGDQLLETAEARVRDMAMQPAFGLVKAQVRGAVRAKLREIAKAGHDPMIAALLP